MLGHEKGEDNSLNMRNGSDMLAVFPLVVPRWKKIQGFTQVPYESHHEIPWNYNRQMIPNANAIPKHKLLKYHPN